MRVIRRANAHDAEAIASLYRELNTLSEPAVAPERIAELAATQHTHLLVCEEDDTILATALVCLCQDVMFGSQPFAVIENVVVGAEHKRTGIGKYMMDYIEAFCSTQNCSKIVLQTSSANCAAQHFYTAMGYNPNTKVGFIKYRRNFSPSRCAIAE